MGKLFGKREFLRLLGSAAVAAPTAAVVAKSQKTVQPRGEEPAFARVTKTNTLRCGYGIWAPGFVRDLQTGQFTGIFHDFLEAIGRHTGLRIEWTEEVSWGDYPAALNSGRIDAMGFGAWPKASIAKEVLFTEPTYFLPIYAYARANDARFDHAIEKADDATVTIAAMDSEISLELANSRFPKAQTVTLPPLTPPDMMLLNVATRKADLTFTDAYTGAAYMEANPAQLKIVPLEHPLRLFGHTIPVGKGEHSLVSLLNTATDEIMTSGEFDQIMQKYEKTPGILLMQRKEYQ